MLALAASDTQRSPLRQVTLYDTAPSVKITGLPAIEMSNNSLSKRHHLVSPRGNSTMARPKSVDWQGPVYGPVFVDARNGFTLEAFWPARLASDVSQIV